MYTSVRYRDGEVVKLDETQGLYEGLTVNHRQLSCMELLWGHWIESIIGIPALSQTV